jgi:hypothetical protein
MLKNKLLTCSVLFLLQCLTAVTIAQQKKDSIVSVSVKDTSGFGKKNPLAFDTSAKKFNPKLATLRSALIPGWGQAYNKKYWKIPIIYGALGTTAGIFFYNLKTYKLLRRAFTLRSDNDPANDILIDPRFSVLSTQSIRTYRNSYRQNIDYSVLFFLIFWGLNVVDATVDAHLKAFDVGNDLSLKIKPTFNSISKSPGLSFVFALKEKTNARSSNIIK